MRAATPLLAALVVVEATDVVFAVDSVPAILALSNEEFLIFSSNAFAILGLRAMYFLLADARQRFHYLNHALGAILIFVGLKMARRSVVHLNVWYLAGHHRGSARRRGALQRAEEPPAGRAEGITTSELRFLATEEGMCSSDIVWFPPQRCPRRHTDRNPQGMGSLHTLYPRWGLTRQGLEYALKQTTIATFCQA